VVFDIRAWFHSLFSGTALSAFFVVYAAHSIARHKLGGVELVFLWILPIAEALFLFYSFAFCGPSGIPLKLDLSRLGEALFDPRFSSCRAKV